MLPLALPAIQFGVGALQSIFSGKGKAQRDLENYANSYKVSGGLLDYYNKALSNYSPNAYTSSYYQNQQNNINRNMAAGINSLQDRRSALSGVARLNQVADDASARAATNAEQIQNQNLSRLGQAAAAKNQAEQKGFGIKYNLKSQKAGQKATLFNNGLQNMFGGLSNAAMLLSGDESGGGSNAYQMPRMPYNPQKLPY